MSPWRVSRGACRDSAMYLLCLCRRVHPSTSARRSVRMITRKVVMNTSSSDSFDKACQQSFENPQRMWSFDRTIQIENPLVTFPWRSICFDALTGQGVIRFKQRLVKETIVKVLKEIHEQYQVGQILIVADNYGSHHAKLTQKWADKLRIEFVFLPPHPPVFYPIKPL